MARTPFSFQGWGRMGWRVYIFSAKKFMKNKKTTARHCNLLPNQGHVVRIVMKLYKKLTGPESV